MRKILYVTTYNPSDSFRGGAAWVDSIVIRALREDCAVEVFSAIPPVVEDMTSSKLRRLLSLSVYVLTRGPYESAKFLWQISWWRRVRVLRQLAKDYELVVSSQWVGLLLIYFARVRCDLHIAHNVDAINAAQYSKRILQILQNAGRVQRTEDRLLQIPAYVAALSATDTQRISYKRPRTVHMQLLPAQVAYVQRARQATVGFLGTMRWGPNLAAYEQLVLSIKEFNKRQPSCPLTIRVGGRYSEDLSPEPFIERLGPIGDLDRFYESVDLIVVPRFGESTGVSVKVLEAVERGTPVICSTEIALALRMNFAMTADTPDEVVQRLTEFYCSENDGSHQEATQDSARLTVYSVGPGELVSLITANGTS